LRLIFIVTSARPSLTRTSPIWPTVTPAITTVWPWPGVSDLPLVNSAL